MIATMLPMVGTDDTASVAVVNGPIELELMLLANMNSLTLDYCCGFKVSGTHIRKHTFNQLPFVPPEHYKGNDYDFIVPRVCRLEFNGPSLMESAIDQGAPRVDAASVDFTRALIKAELVAYYAHLYGLSRSEL